jgi:xanthine dehydrogenase YagT iron-sulfur-binding subunit
MKLIGGQISDRGVPLANDRKPTAVTEVPEKEQQDGTAEHSLFGRVTRRSFLSHLGAAGIAATASPVLAATATPESPAVDQAAEAPPAGTVPVTLRVNGKTHALQLDPRTTLLDCLRENLNLPGTKKGCDHGQCGACTVHVNGERVNSCLSFAVMHSKDEITTIEGIGQPDHLHPMQAAFVEHDGYQCGYCTSGQIMSAVALLAEPVGPSDEDVKQAMYGNICRCGAYPNIVAAVQAVRGRA